MSWYVAREGSPQHGPLSTVQVLQAIAAGKIGPDCHVGCTGTPWRPIMTVPEFAGALQRPALDKPLNVRPRRDYFRWSLLAIVVTIAFVNSLTVGAQATRIAWELFACWGVLVGVYHLLAAHPALATRVKMLPELGAPVWRQRRFALLCGIALCVTEVLIMFSALYRSPAEAALASADPCAAQRLGEGHFGPVGSELRTEYDQSVERCRTHLASDAREEASRAFEATCVKLPDQLRAHRLDTADLAVVAGQDGAAASAVLTRLAASALDSADLKITPDTLACSKQTWSLFVDSVSSSPHPWVSLSRADDISHELRQAVAVRGAGAQAKQAVAKRVDALIAKIGPACVSADTCRDGDSLCDLEFDIVGGTRLPRCLAVQEKFFVFRKREEAAEARKDTADTRSQTACFARCNAGRSAAAAAADNQRSADCTETCGGDVRCIGRCSAPSNADCLMRCLD